jgi:hypothetical protein
MSNFKIGDSVQVEKDHTDFGDELGTVFELDEYYLTIKLASGHYAWIKPKDLKLVEPQRESESGGALQPLHRITRREASQANRATSDRADARGVLASHNVRWGELKMNTIYKPDHEPAPPVVVTLNAADAAKAIGISKKMLASLVASGEIAVVQLSRQTQLFDPDDLRAWRDSRKTKALAKG